MRVDEVRALGELGRLTLRGSVTRVADLHRGIADRVFGAVGPAAAPVRAVHDAIAGVSYASVRAALGAGARAAGTVAARGADGRALDEDRAGRTALAALGGAHGDLLERVAPALAQPMAVRVDGRPVPLETGALAAAFPGATGRLAVFLHGLTETEASWGYRAPE